MKVSELRKLIKEAIQEVETLTLKAGDKIDLTRDNQFYYLLRTELNGNKVDYDDINKGLKELEIPQRLTIRNSTGRLQAIKDALAPKGIELNWKSISI